jgi:uncharacterized oxidoreductase
MNAELDAVIAFVKSSRPGKNGGPVLVAGDPERAMRRQRLDEGIPMNDTTWEEIVQAGQKVGMAREEIEKLRV